MPRDLIFYGYYVCICEKECNCNISMTKMDFADKADFSSPTARTINSMHLPLLNLYTDPTENSLFGDCKISHTFKNGKLDDHSCDTFGEDFDLCGWTGSSSEHEIPELPGTA